MARPARPAAKKKAAGAEPAPVSEAEAQAQLDGFIDRYTPEVASLGRKVLAHLRRRLPGAVSMVYDNYNYLAIGFGPIAKVSAIPISIALYPRWVTLFFMQGALLPDPDGMLEGKGAVVRSIRVTDASQLKDEKVDALISTALLHIGWKLEPKAKHRLIIQSISAKQRPRRP